MLDILTTLHVLCLCTVLSLIHSGKVYSIAIESLLQGKAWLSTVDLLVLTSLDQAIIIYLPSKQAILMRRSTVLSLPFQLVFPGFAISKTASDSDSRCTCIS